VSVLTQLILTLIPFIYILGTVGLDVWALVDLYQRPNKHKLVWLILILFAPLIGAIAYLIINRDDSRRR
jgi:hypothetical protein